MLPPSLQLIYCRTGDPAVAFIFSHIMQAFLTREHRVLIIPVSADSLYMPFGCLGEHLQYRFASVQAEKGSKLVFPDIHGVFKTAGYSET